MSHSDDFLRRPRRQSRIKWKSKPADLSKHNLPTTLLLDVARTRKSFDQVNLEGATTLGRGKLEMGSTKWAPTRAPPIVVYCAGRV